MNQLATINGVFGFESSVITQSSRIVPLGSRDGGVTWARELIASFLVSIDVRI